MSVALCLLAILAVAAVCICLLSEDQAEKRERFGEVSQGYRAQKQWWVR